MTVEVIEHDDVTDINRFNDLLDAITEKRFVAPAIFIQAVRAACDLHGIVLPLLPIEGENGNTVSDGHAILIGATSATKPTMSVPHDECEEVLHIEDGNGNVTDTYLYIVVDKDEEGLYECYAQIVDDDELKDVINMVEKDYPELVKTNKYLKQTSATRGDIVDDTPPNE